MFAVSHKCLKTVAHHYAFIVAYNILLPLLYALSKYAKVLEAIVTIILYVYL